MSHPPTDLGRGCLNGALIFFILFALLFLIAECTRP